MDIAEVRASFPVLEFESAVTHQTPRVPIAFEWIVLRLHERFAADPVWSSVSLPRIFADILRVPDPGPVVVPVLRNLVGLGILRVPAGPENFPALALRDLERTELGDRVLKERLLPGRPSEETVVHSYDPVLGRILEPEEARLLDEKPLPVRLSDAPFTGVYPADAIRERLPGEGHRWWRPDTRIESLKRTDGSTLWRRSTLTFRLENGNVLRVACRDPLHEEYLAGLPAEELARQFVEPVFFEGIEIPAALPAGSAGSVEKAGGRLFPVRELAEKASLKGGFKAMEPLPGLLPAPSDAPAKTALAVFGAETAPPEGTLEWNDAKNGAILRFPSPFPAGGMAYWDGNGTCLGAQQFAVRVGRGTLHVPLGVSLPGGRLAESLAPAKAAVESRIGTHGRLEDRLLALLWRDEEEVWKGVFAELDAGALPFAEAAKEALRLRGIAAALTGARSSPAWTRGIEDLFLARADRYPGFLPAEEMRKAAQALADCGIKGGEKARALARAAQARMKPPENIDEMDRAFDAFSPLGIGPSDEFPTPLRTKAVVAEMLWRFSEKGFEESWRWLSPLEKALKGLKAAESELRRSAGVPPAELAPEKACQTAIRNADLGAFRKAAAEWSRRIEALRALSAEMTELVGESPLQKVDVGVRAFLDFAGMTVSGLDPKYRRVFVVDTCVLIDRPELPSDLRPDELAIVSKRVIEELDDKKKDPTAGPGAAQAIRVLKDCKAGNVRHEEGNSRLLPPENRTVKGDNCILSLALKHRPCNPILLTNDNALALKAKAEGLRSCTLAEFLGRNAKASSGPSPRPGGAKPGGENKGGSGGKKTKR